MLSSPFSSVLLTPAPFLKYLTINVQLARSWSHSVRADFSRLSLNRKQQRQLAFMGVREKGAQMDNTLEHTMKDFYATTDESAKRRCARLK